MEFGKQLWWRPPRTTSYNVLLEPRWRAGIWLGRRWGSSVHIVYDAQDGTVHHIRAVQRRPLPERWSLEAVQAAAAVPGMLRQPATAGEPEPLEILPPVEDPAQAVPPPR